MVSRYLASELVWGLLLSLPGRAAAAPDCSDVVPSAIMTPQPKRALTPEDLVRLRDIGPVDPTQQYAGLFSVSPDGRRAAFQLRRADPAANGYCLVMVVVELRPDGKAVVVDRGGDFIRYRFDFRGKAGFPSGVADAITPRWSPDGRWIVYRRRDRGAVQLWRARTDGSGSEAIIDSIDDVEDFRVTADGNGIVYAPGRGCAKRPPRSRGRACPASTMTIASRRLRAVGRPLFDSLACCGKLACVGLPRRMCNS